MWNKVEVKTFCEKPKAKPEIADTFNWSKEERQKLREDFLVWELRKKLIAKYPEQRCFFETAQIKVMELGKDNKEHEEAVKQLGTNIFLLFSPEWKLLSYLDKDWITMLDVINYNFDEDSNNLLTKKYSGNFFRKNVKSWKLEFIENSWKIYEEGSRRFNNAIYLFLWVGKYLK